MTDNLPAVVPMPELNQNDIVQLARAVAMDLQTLPVIIATANLTPEQFAVIEKTPFFQAVRDAYVIEWEAAKNTPERIKLQAAVTLEDALPKLGARMKSSAEDLNKAVEAAKLFSKLAGVGERDSAGLSGEKITISINLGNNEKIVLEQAIAPANPTSDTAGAVSIVTEGQGDLVQIPTDRKE